MKRGPDLDIEALFTDLGNDPLSVATTEIPVDTDIETDVDGSVQDDEYSGDDEYSHDDEYSER